MAILMLSTSAFGKSLEEETTFYESYFKDKTSDHMAVCLPHEMYADAIEKVMSSQDLLARSAHEEAVALIQADLNADKDDQFDTVAHRNEALKGYYCGKDAGFCVPSNDNQPKCCGYAESLGDRLISAIVNVHYPGSSFDCNTLSGVLKINGTSFNYEAGKLNRFSAGNQNVTRIGAVTKVNLFGSEGSLEILFAADQPEEVRLVNYVGPLSVTDKELTAAYMKHRADYGPVKFSEKFLAETKFAKEVLGR